MSLAIRSRFKVLVKLWRITAGQFRKLKQFARDKIMSVPGDGKDCIKWNFSSGLNPARVVLFLLVSFFTGSSDEYANKSVNTLNFC